MKILLINGSPRQSGNTAAALSIVEEALIKNGLETRWFQTGSKPVRGCAACGGCKGTNRCVFTGDSCNELIDAILGADGVIIGSPVYFAGPNGALCALLDRVFYATCTRNQLFKGKPAAALTTCAWVGGSAALDRLQRYFVPCQMPVVTSSDYPVFTSDSIAGRDKRTLEILHTLGDNMAVQLGIRR